MRITKIYALTILFLLNLLILSGISFAQSAPATMQDFWDGKAYFEFQNKFILPTDGRTAWVAQNMGTDIVVKDNVWYMFTREYLIDKPKWCNEAAARDAARIVVRTSKDKGKTWSGKTTVIEPTQGTPNECSSIDGDAYFDSDTGTWQYIYQCMANDALWNICHATLNSKTPSAIFVQDSKNPIIKSGEILDKIAPGFNQEGTPEIAEKRGDYFYVTFHGYRESDGNAIRIVAKTKNWVDWETVNDGPIFDKSKCQSWNVPWDSKGCVGGGAGTILKDDTNYYMLMEAMDKNLGCIPDQNWVYGLLRSPNLESTSWTSMNNDGAVIAYSSKEIGMVGGSRIPVELKTENYVNGILRGHKRQCSIQYQRLFKDTNGDIYLLFGRLGEIENVDTDSKTGIYIFKLKKNVPFASYKFREGNGHLYTNSDIISNGNFEAKTSNVQWIPKEDGTNTLEFNGATSYVEMPANKLFNLNEDLTMEINLKLSSLPTDKSAFIAGKLFSYWLELYPDSNLCFWLFNNGGQFSTCTKIKLNEYQKIQATYGSNQISIYNNGILSNSAPTTGKGASLNEARVRLGNGAADSNGFYGSFMGSVDYFKIYNYTSNVGTNLHNSSLLDPRLAVVHVAGTYPQIGDGFLVQGAKKAIELGFQGIELYVSPEVCWQVNDAHPKGQYQTLDWCQLSENSRILQFASHPRYKEVFNLPFKTFFLTSDTADLSAANGAGIALTRFTQTQLDKTYADFYEYSKYLLSTYKNSGKTFIIQSPNEMDHQLLANKQDKNSDPDDFAIENGVDYLNTIQNAIDDAKRDNPNPGVELYHGCEVNMVVKGMAGKKSAVNNILPRTHCDLYGYSAWESLNPDDNTLANSLEYLAKKAPDSKSFGSKNVYISELGASVFIPNVGAIGQAGFVDNQIKKALDWGAPYVLYWELYDNECKAPIPPKESQCPGYWIVKPSGELSDVYTQSISKYKDIPLETDPIIEINVSPASSIYEDNIVKIDANATNSKFVTNIKLLVDGEEKQICSSGSCSHTQKYDVGNHKFTAIVTDLLGNSKIRASQEFYVNKRQIVQNCIDSDGGINYNEKGEVTGKLYSNGSIETLSDDCDESNGIYLNERFCGKDGYLEYEYYKCPNGCKDGACVENSNKQSFKFSLWTCADGTAYSKLDSSSCKSFDEWQGLAKESCKNQLASFNVRGSCGNKLINENVECVFNNAQKEEKCSSGDNICYGTQSCDLSVQGKNGDTISWSSSCSDEQFKTVIDGKDEKIVFNCVNPVCNNGIIERGEFCDGNNLGTYTKCTDIELFKGGNLKCDKTFCNYDFSECILSTCGNGKIDENGEQCDADKFPDQTKSCSDIWPYVGGTLKCNQYCKFDTSGCIKPVCGNGKCEMWENDRICSKDCHENAIGPQSTLVIVAEIGDKQPSADVETAKKLIFGNVEGTVGDFYDKNSYGKVSFTGKVVGQYKLPAELHCFGDELLAEAMKAADKDVYFPDYNRIILDVPWLSDCGGVAGYADIGTRLIQSPDGPVRASVSTDFSFTDGVVGHELGHNFGTNHANLMRCLNCQSNEYGDQFDIMGSGGLKYFNAPHKEEVGWLDQDNIITTTEGEYLIKPLEQKLPKGDIQQIKLPWKTGHPFYVAGTYLSEKFEPYNMPVFYSLEFRQPIGYDAGSFDSMYSGVLLHIAAVPSNPYDYQTNLIITDSYSLMPGKTFKDSANDYEIQVESVTKDGALVKISHFNADNKKPVGVLQGSEFKDDKGNKQLYIFGWAADPDTVNEPVNIVVTVNDPINQNYYFDRRDVLANGQSKDASDAGYGPNHGFEIPIKSYNDIELVHGYATDTWNGPLVELQGSPITIKQTSK